jgi:hypothetical protein
MLQSLGDHHRRFDGLAARGNTGSKLSFPFLQEEAEAAHAV